MTNIPISTLIRAGELAREAKDFTTLEVTPQGLELRQSRRVPGKPTAHQRHLFAWSDLASMREPDRIIEKVIEQGPATIDRLIASGAVVLD